MRLRSAFPMTAPPRRPDYTFATEKYQPQSSTSVSTIALIFLGLISLILYLRILALGDLRQRIPEFLVCYFALSILYLLAGALVVQKAQAGRLPSILIFALLFRLVLFFSAPSLSDDIFRYAWEGYLQTHGINPYRVPPQAPELAPLRNDIWERVNNKDVSAIYPPLIQMVHAATYWLFRSVWGFKLLFLAVEAILVWVLLQLLAAHSRDYSRIIFYAWNPLAIVETAGNGHYDVCVVALLLGSALLYHRNEYRKSIFLYTSSVLCKLYPLLGLPFLVRRIPARYFVWFPLIVAGTYLPYASAGNHLFSALWYYREKWRFNGFLFQQLSESLFEEKITERLLLLALALVLIWSYLRVSNLLEQLYRMTGAILLCAPTLFPWYLVWLAPFLCFFPNPAWLLLTSLVGLSYYVLIDWWTLGIWQQDLSFLKLQYYPFYGLLIADYLWKRRRVSKSKKPEHSGSVEHTV